MKYSLSEIFWEFVGFALLFGNFVLLYALLYFTKESGVF